jgi:Putative beta-lactamase-inhibitor-like, PepSY-like
MRFLKYIFLISIFSMLSIVVHAQEQIDEADVPEVVVDKFGNLFPTAEAKMWLQDAELYFVSCDYDGYDTQASFQENGKWLSTIMKMGIEEMPRNVDRNIKAKFDDYEIIQSQYTEKSGAEYYYYVQLLVDSQEIELFFSNVTGEIIRQIGGDDPISNNQEKKAISRKELPTAIDNYIKKVYSAFRYRNAYLLNNEEWNNTYYVVLSLDGEPDIVELYFDFKGNLEKKIDPYKDRKIMIQNNNAVVNENIDQEKKGDQGEDFISEDKVPDAVLASFKKKVRKPDEVSWTKEKKKIYVAHYFNLITNEDAKTSFADNGEWLMTEENVDQGKLRPLITRYLDETYPECDILKSTFQTTNDKSKFFYLQLYERPWRKMDTIPYHQLWFAYSGRIEKVKEVYIESEYDKYEDEMNQEEWDEFQNELDETSFNVNEQESTSISEKELPSKIINYILDNYSYDYRYKETMIVEHEGAMSYYVVMQEDGSKERHVMYFDIYGELLDKKIE